MSNGTYDMVSGLNGPAIDYKGCPRPIVIFSNALDLPRLAPLNFCQPPLDPKFPGLLPHVALPTLQNFGDFIGSLTTRYESPEVRQFFLRPRVIRCHVNTSLAICRAPADASPCDCSNTAAMIGPLFPNLPQAPQTFSSRNFKHSLLKLRWAGTDHEGNLVPPWFSLPLP
jgi:hypothetical protein